MSSVPDHRYFARVATQTGFRPEPLETVFRLTSLLGDIDAALPGQFALRGGTALNVFHLDLPRLSVDIDLDFVAVADSDQARERRPEVLAALAATCERAGYRVERERDSYALAHLRLGYQNASGRPAFLKVDVNFLDRVPVLPPECQPARHPFEGDLREVVFATHRLAELAAGKVIALARRTLARDLFDVAMLSVLPNLNVDEVRTVLAVRGASYPPPSPADYTPDVVQAVRTTSWRSEVLALCHRPIPLSLDQAQARASDLIGRLTDMPAGHRSFLKHLDAGILRPDLLGRADLEDRVVANPGLLWRLQAGTQRLEER